MHGRSCVLINLKGAFINLRRLYPSVNTEVDQSLSSFTLMVILVKLVLLLQRLNTMVFKKGDGQVMNNAIRRGSQSHH